MGIRLLHFGLGPIGRAILGVTQERGWPAVAALDTDPELAGGDLGRLIPGDKDVGVRVTADAAEALGTAADVVVLATSSRIEQIAGQIEACLDAGLHVVSTCEELSFPWFHHAELGERIDARAREAGRVVLGTGVNPGYLMEYLPLVCSGLCRNVRKLRVRRFQDASPRRRQFQEKIGAGLTTDEFDARVSDGRMGHVGLVESVALLAHGLGWELDQIDESILPVLADRSVGSAEIAVPAGGVRGMRQEADGRIDGQTVISLQMVAALGWDGPHEAIDILGEPPIRLRMDPVHGDRATAAVVANVIPRVGSAPPGLRTMIDFSAAGGVPRSPVGPGDTY